MRPQIFRNMDDNQAAKLLHQAFSGDL